MYFQQLFSLTCWLENKIGMTYSSVENQYRLSWLYWCLILHQYSSFGNNFNEIALLIKCWGITVEVFAMKYKYCRNFGFLFRTNDSELGKHLMLTKLYNIVKIYTM